MFSSTQVPKNTIFESHPQISRSMSNWSKSIFRQGDAEWHRAGACDLSTKRTPGHDVHIYFFFAVGKGGIRFFFCLAVFEVDENSEKKPISRCIFLLPLAGGALANPEWFGWTLHMPALPWTRMYVWWFSHIRILTVPIQSSNPEETSALSHRAEDYFACLGGIWWVFLVMTWWQAH